MSFEMALVFVTGFTTDSSFGILLIHIDIKGPQLAKQAALPEIYEKKAEK